METNTISPMMEEMLVHEVVFCPRNVARTIPKIGHEDDEEIIQDATLMAAWMMDSEERAGHPITAGNASYYAAKTARSGRRSYHTGRSAALSLKRCLAADLIEFSGEDVIRQLLDGVRPGWESDLRTVRDRHLCLVANTADPSGTQPRGYTTSPESHARGSRAGCGFFSCGDPASTSR